MMQEYTFYHTSFALVPIGDMALYSETYQVVRKCEVFKKIQSRQLVGGYKNVVKLKEKEIIIESDQPMKQIPEFRGFLFFSFLF